LLSIGGADPLHNGTTENIGALCEARTILIERASGDPIAENLYTYEPLVWKRDAVRYCV